MQYAVVDFLWFRSLKGDKNSIGFDTIDEWGRMLPDPGRWPSSGGGRGFSDIANKVHSMSLKFGIHLMAGISTQAFNNNTPILDTITVYCSLLISATFFSSLSGNHVIDFQSRILSSALNSNSMISFLKDNLRENSLYYVDVGKKNLIVREKSCFFLFAPS